MWWVRREPLAASSALLLCAAFGSAAVWCQRANAVGQWVPYGHWVVCASLFSVGVVIV